MGLLNEPEESKPAWRQCLECGNRFMVGDDGTRPSWCSTACEHLSLRRQRDAIENSWLRATWFLR
ncbi:MAG TPA: hypothetical protein VF115_12190 [Acidimicrobiia bacterium]